MPISPGRSTSRPSCSTCKFWSATDKTLDGGRSLIGTCSRPPDYDALLTAKHREANWSEDRFVALVRGELANEGAVVQVAGGDGFARAYLRTSPGFYCASFTPQALAPAQPSLTGSAA